MAQDWTGRSLPPFTLESLDGERWDERRLADGRAVIFCFASW
jgi:hypothetical protein